MEALTLLLHGFAVLLTWKTLTLMMIGLLLAAIGMDMVDRKSVV